LNTTKELQNVISCQKATNTQACKLLCNAAGFHTSRGKKEDKSSLPQLRPQPSITSG